MLLVLQSMSLYSLLWQFKSKLKSSAMVMIVHSYPLFLLSFLIVLCTARALEVERRLNDASEVTNTLKKALGLLDDMANLVYQRFEFHNWPRYQFFLESSNMPVYGWDLIKYRIAKKVLTPQSSYLMIFGGSSVTAGHDNYYHQAYPFVYERRMKSVFEALGINLLVHNIAQGANNCRPSNHCYEAMGGEDADWVGWEQSFNCGRARDIPEFVARVAYWSKGVVYYIASGAFVTSDCAPTKDPIPWTSEEWTPEKAGITSKYTIKKDSLVTFRQLMGDWYDDGNSVSRFTNQVYGGLYRGVGPHGYSVWGHSSKLCNNGTGCTAVDMKGPCYEQGGPHWMVAETSYFAGEKGHFGKTWHPPAGMHLMRGEVLAYNMGHVIADALHMVLDDLKTMTKEQAIEKYDKSWQELYVPIPEKGLHLSNEESRHKPLCYTNYRPHFNPKFLLEGIVVGKPVGFVYRDLKQPVGSEMYGYKDERPYWDAQGPNCAISFRISNVRSGDVRVCGYDHKESLQHAAFFLDPFYYGNTTSIANKEYTPSAKRYELPKHIYMQDECTRLPDIPLGGDHVLTVETRIDGRPVSVSHVIVF